MPRDVGDDEPDTADANFGAVTILSILDEMDQGKTTAEEAVFRQIQAQSRMRRADRALASRCPFCNNTQLLVRSDVEVAAHIERCRMRSRAK